MARDDLFEDEEWAEGPGLGALDQFKGFDYPTRIVGTALAWTYHWVGARTLTSMLSRAGLRAPSRKPFTVAMVAASLRTLHQRGFAVCQYGEEYGMFGWLAHMLVAMAYHEKELLVQLRRLPRVEVSGYGYVASRSREPHYFDDEDGEREAMRDLRHAYLDGDTRKMESVVRAIERTIPHAGSWSFVLAPVDLERLRALPLSLFWSAVAGSRVVIFDDFCPAVGLVSLMRERAAKPEHWRMVAECELFRGNWQGVVDAEEVLDTFAERDTEIVRLELLGARSYLQGMDDEAIAAFEDSMKSWRKRTRKRKCFPEGLYGIWYLAALVRRGRPEDLAEAAAAADDGAALFGHWVLFLQPLESIAKVRAGRVDDKLREALVEVRDDWQSPHEPQMRDLWFYLMVVLMSRADFHAAKVEVILRSLVAAAQKAGAGWVAAEAAVLRDEWTRKPSAEDKQETAGLLAALGPSAKGLARVVRPVEDWERTLVVLETLGHEVGEAGKKGKRGKKVPAQKQLVWWFDVRDSGFWSLQPIERTVSATGRVSKGRKVALKRLKERSVEMPFLSEQDRRLAACIELNAHWDRPYGYVLSKQQTLLELAGHPYVFADSEATLPLEVVKVTPRLAITESGDGLLCLSLTPQCDYSKARPQLVEESESRALVVDVTAVHVRLAAALADGGARIPVAAKDRVVKALGRLTDEIAMESDEEILGDVGIRTIAAESTPVMRLVPHGEGLLARLMVRPVREEEFASRPGEGKALLVARQDGAQVQVRRDLAREREAAEEVLAACATFVEVAEEGDRWSAHLSEPLECLEVLAQLHELDATQVTVEWPEGQPFRVRSLLETSKFEIALGGGKDWLTASGTLELDEDQVLSMRQLVELLAESGATPGFVKLDDGQFLALSEKFRRQLEDLRAFSQAGKGDKLRIHPLAALALEELSEDPAVKTGAAWKKQFAKLRESAAAEPPEPPSTLQAELRPYQVEGYRWLRQLAEWGMGACLADDMGLGKTVQTLALLLDRAPDGPALVVAPTSVAANWRDEATRFAPTLRPVVFGRPGEDREAILDRAGPFDLIITSYGLLQSEGERFAGVSWHTVILDEAQAIKNRATKRSKAAMKLTAGFRLITTGTPVENRLAELHNLFQFLNPGLLGSWERFRRGFADPIERNDDREARERLRRLVRPFILRRLKAEVLRDLPSRTEIALQVELSAEEAAFYEALRRKAVDDLARAGEAAEPGSAAIRILAELTRLRRACCHPRLIDPQTPLEGSKLRVFAETLAEILGGNHKVLVFSQFVDHLRLIREHLDREKISYQYLDGSTPTAKREKAVRDFQSGVGEVFLISLKAGGFGLNLTAADYVIHMDPWWNPAAEDQASDRAHRIGQTRPVTIYRLITSGTIEEKIVELHHRKRELADSILEGTDSAGRLTPEELLALLRDDR